MEKEENPGVYLPEAKKFPLKIYKFYSRFPWNENK
jgi:hypothetical protein